jgi:hypothetical protein
MEALTPDLAEKVLTAEVRNIIKKVSDGGTLSASARTMFHKAALSPALKNQARVASLFSKWAAGGRLSADELSEMHAWTILQDRPFVEEAPQCLEETGENFALDPDGPRIAGSRVKYPKKLADYAKQFGPNGPDERTLKRYVQRGHLCKPPDLPPFHRPELMPAWWERRMKNSRCPAWILKAASQATAAKNTPPSAPEAAPPPSPESTPNQESSAPLLSRDFSDVVTLDFAQNVEQLRRSLAISNLLLEEARAANPPDESLISSRQRNYRETYSELRKAESDLQEWKQKQGHLVSRDEVRSENNRIAASIYQAVLRLVKNVRPQLTGRSDAEQDRIWQKEVIACFTALKTAKFTGFAPE